MSGLHAETIHLTLTIPRIENEKSHPHARACTAYTACDSIPKLAGMLEMPTSLRQLWIVAGLLLAQCARAQSGHYSVLCGIDLTRGSKAVVHKADTFAFELTVAGHKISQITAVSAAGARRIFILRDVSGSMNGENEQKLSMEVLKHLIELSGPADQLALVDFSDITRTIIPLQDTASFARAFADPKKVNCPTSRAGPPCTTQSLLRLPSCKRTLNRETAYS